MAKIKVSRYIPLPGKQHNKKWGQTKYPFATMEEGHSFPVTTKNRHTVSTLAKIYGDRNNKKFTVRLDDKGNLRCWRTEL